MNSRKLAKARGELVRMRRSPQKASDLIPMAEKLGRKRVNRGKEPTWESEHFPKLPPVAIPIHKGRDLHPRVRNNILDCLENDLLEWEEWLEENGDEENDEDD